MAQVTSYSYEVPTPGTSVLEGKPRRSVHAKEELVGSGRSHTKSVFESFKAGVQKKIEGNCLGKRVMSSDPNTPYLWESYSKVYDRVICFGSGLQTYGITKGSMVGVCCRTCPEWVIAEQACYAYGLIAVPMFENLRPSTFEHIINETEMSLLITTSEKLDMMLMDRNKYPSLRIVILIDGVNEVEKERGHSVDLMLFGFVEVEETGKLGLVDAVPAGTEEVVAVVYKEDPSGIPKGVALTNLNMLAAMAGLDILGNSGAFVKIAKDDVLMAFMPFADITQFLWLNFALGEGAEIGFYRGDFHDLTADIEALRPTVFCAAPGLLSSLHSDIISRIDEAGPLTTAFFNMAVKGKKKNLKHGKMDHYLYDKLVFKKIRSSFGGRVRALVTTATPNSHEVAGFFRVAFGCEVYEGYSLTETTGFATSTLMGDYEAGHIGAPVPCNEIKLINSEECGYLCTDKPLSRGEICIRGPNVFKAYYKDLGATRQVLDQDGWFHTRDLGVIDNKGRFRYMDSIDSVIKLKNGTLVSPEKVESVLSKSKWVAWCLVCADSTNEFLIAIIVPWEHLTADWAKDHKIPGENMKEWIKNQKLKDAIWKDLNKLGSKNGLSIDEKVRNIFIDDTIFSVENELLTSEYRLIRPNIKKYYQAQLDETSASPLNVAGPSRRTSLLQSPQSPLQGRPTPTTTTTTATTTTTTPAAPAATPAPTSVAVTTPASPVTPATPTDTPVETPAAAPTTVSGETEPKESAVPPPITVDKDVMAQPETLPLGTSPVKFKGELKAQLKAQRAGVPEDSTEFTDVPLEQQKLTVQIPPEQQQPAGPQAGSSLSPVSG